MCRFLTPKRNGIYYFRRPIPERLRHIIGQREWFFSLKETNPEQAKRLVALETVRTDQLLADAKKMLAAAQPASPAQIVEQWRTEERRRRREDREREREKDDVEFARLDDERMARIEAQAMEEAHLRRVIETGQTALMEPQEAVVIRAIRDAQDNGAIMEERWRIAQAELRELKRAAGDSQGGKMASRLPSLPKPGNAPERTPQGISQAVTVTGLFEAYAAIGNLSPAIVKEWTTKIDKFVEFLGHDDARRVTVDNIRAWRNHVRDEALPDDKRRSAQTVNSGYLAPIRSAFKYGVSEGMIAQDPAKEVARVTAPKVAKIREKDFTKAEQRKILSAASMIQTGEGASRQSLVRRWVPWICAYTGARVNEITQLRAEDVQQIDGHWVIKITPEAGRVKTNDFRYVPVHEHLMEQGFLAVAKAQKQGPIFYDPDKADPDSERGQYKKAGERLALWVRGLGITDPSIKPNHAWRHTFKTIALEVGMHERAADYMQGHVSKGVGRSYGHATIKALVDQMALVPRFETD